jgi:hypothetical protein
VEEVGYGEIREVGEAQNAVHLVGGGEGASRLVYGPEHAIERAIAKRQLLLEQDACAERSMHA